jgi:hypothetical protein
MLRVGIGPSNTSTKSQGYLVTGSARRRMSRVIGGMDHFPAPFHPSSLRIVNELVRGPSVVRLLINRNLAFKVDIDLPRRPVTQRKGLVETIADRDRSCVASPLSRATATYCIASSTAVPGHSVEASPAFKKGCGYTISTGAGRYPLTSALAIKQLQRSSDTIHLALILELQDLLSNASVLDVC